MHQHPARPEIREAEVTWLALTGDWMRYGEARYDRCRTRGKREVVLVIQPKFSG